MATSRRKFIKAGTLGALFAGIPLKAAAREIFESPATFTSTDLNRGLDMRAFAQHLNSEFRIHHANSKVTSVKLIEVNDLRSPSATNTQGVDSKECFSTVFLGSNRPSLPQSTYTVEHRSLGKFSVLLVPVGQSKTEQHYEAIFNRLR